MRRLRSFDDNEPFEDLAPVLWNSFSYSGGEKSSVGTPDMVGSGSCASLGAGVGVGFGAGLGAASFPGWDGVSGFF